MKQLFIIIKGKYLEKIIRGEKKEEYRLITSYWKKKLSKEYDTILFQAGYSKNSIRAEVEFLGVEQKKINHNHFNDLFNNEPKEVFAIQLGEVLIVKNTELAPNG